MELHKDQERALPTLLMLLTSGKRVCAVAPTGSGKTVVAAEVIKELLKRFRKKRVLFLAHRYELLGQAIERIIAAGVPKGQLGLLSGVKKHNCDARVLVASVAMFGRRDVPDDVGFIVVDECHRIEADSYQAILDALPGVPVLGLTATPKRLDGKPLSDTFDELLVMAGQTELIAAKRIARPITYGVPYKKALALVSGLKSMGGDYATGPLARAMMKRKLMGDVVSEACRLAPGERTLVFAVNREHGHALAERFKEAGRPTEYLDGLTPDAERAGMIQRLGTGETEVLVNIDVLTEGFDMPAVKCIVLARPTKSVTRFLQYCGRAARIYNGKRPIIIDNAGNCWRFGLPDAEREWSLDGKEKGDGTNTGGKYCTECGVMMALNASRCPECGAAAPMTERELEEQQATLEQLRASQDEQERKRSVLRMVAKRHGVGEDWVERALKEAV